MRAPTPNSETILSSLLWRAGYKATPARLALLQLLQKRSAPLSIHEIMSGLKGKKIDQATVYRTLAMLEKIGVVRAVDLRHGHVDYEFAGDDHHHLICTNCGKLEDFRDCDLSKLEQKVLQRSKGFSAISRHSLEFFGLCNACSSVRQ